MNSLSIYDYRVGENCVIGDNSNYDQIFSAKQTRKIVISGNWRSGWHRHKIPLKELNAKLITQCILSRNQNIGLSVSYPISISCLDEQSIYYTKKSTHSFWLISPDIFNEKILYEIDRNSEYYEWTISCFNGGCAIQDQIKILDLTIQVSDFLGNIQLFYSIWNFEYDSSDILFASSHDLYIDKLIRFYRDSGQAVC